MPHRISISTDLVPGHLRNEFWREVSRPLLEVSPPSDDPMATLEGSITSHAVGSLLLGVTTFNRQRYERDRHTIAQSGLDHYLLQLFTAGSLAADCEGRILSVARGDIVVFDLDRPLRSEVQSGSTVSIVLPRDRLEKALGWRNLHGLVLPGSDPVVRLVADLVVSLAGPASQLAGAEALVAEDALLALLVLGLQRRELDMTTNENSLLTKTLQQQMLVFIDTHLFDPDLGPAKLMRHFRISRAHLYRIFAGDGGIARVIRGKRLDNAFREIVRCAGHGPSITELAYRLGFSSSGQFSRAFRKHDGISPRDASGGNEFIPSVSGGLAGLNTHFDHFAAICG